VSDAKRLIVPEVLDSSDRSIERAAAALRAGEVVAFPTETVYGLGADAFNPQAIARIYELKGRPGDNPLIVHVQGAAQAKELLVEEWSARCGALAARFWPGPLTMILKRRAEVPAIAAAGLDTLAVRAPAHSGAQRLLRAFGAPIAAPSANRSGHVSPTTAAHVADDFRDERELLILDGGPCSIGIESTVLDMTTDPPRILRPGTVTREELKGAIGPVIALRVDSQQASPGTAARHYAPRTPASMMDYDSIVTALREAEEQHRGGRLAVLWLSDPPPDVALPHASIAMPRAAADYAATLYDALRRADSAGVDRILIETPPRQAGVWQSIHDRLRRATAL